MTPSPPPPPLLLDADRVRRALAPAALAAAIADGLSALARGDIEPGATLQLPGAGGIFHVKSASRRVEPRRAAVKLNGNFPGNPSRCGWPTVQGLVALVDGDTGALLALLDSGALTALRTAATSVVAARHLANRDAAHLAILGCGRQGREHLRQLAALRPLRSVRLFDADRPAATALARIAAELGLEAALATSPGEAARDADLVVTATTATRPVLDEADVGPGAFVAAVGADNPAKVELAPGLLARSAVVVDALAAAAGGGDLRAAIAAGAMTTGDVRGELPAIVAGLAPGRLSPTERIVFDSTGLAATDLVAAELAWRAAAADPAVPRFDFRPMALDD